MKVGKYDVNKKNILSYIAGTSNKILDHYDINPLPDYMISQVVLRAALCKPCLDAGECLKCHCKTPAMFFDPNKECEDGKWTKMMDAKQWDGFSANMLEQISSMYSYFNKNRIGTPDQKAPKSSKTLTFDFGYVEGNTPISHVFTLVNDGETSLEIEKVTSSCGCTVPTYSNKEILPRDEYSVTLTYDNQSDNNFTKEAVVKFKDGVTQNIRLVITGKKDKENMTF